jgi:hypothetical protein
MGSDTRSAAWLQISDDPTPRHGCNAARLQISDETIQRRPMAAAQHARSAAWLQISGQPIRRRTLATNFVRSLQA